MQRATQYQFQTNSGKGNIAVIIVNYGTADLAADAVRSLRAMAQSARTLEIHLLDNASPNADAKVLQDLHKAEQWGDAVTLHIEPENRGFGRGNNVVLQQLLTRADCPEFIMLLNPDARLKNNAPDILATFLEAHPKVGCAGARIFKPGDQPVSAAFRFPTALVEFVSAAGLGPLTRLSGGKTLWHAPDLPTGPVDWVAGAAVMFRRDALAQVGTFDPDFFLYFEEVELMWRLAENGWPCWYVAEAHVEHIEGAATEVRSGEATRKAKPAYWYHSQAMYFAKTTGAIRAVGRAAARLCGAFLHAVVARLRGRTPDLPQNFFADYRRMVLSPLLSGLFKSAPARDSAPLTTPLSLAQHDIEIGVSRTDCINNGRADRNPAGIGLRALIAEDFRTHGRDLFSQGFWALFWHRYGNWRMRIQTRALRLPFTLFYKIGYKMTQWVCGIKLPYTVVVGRRVKLEHFGTMILVARAIGDDVMIRQNTTFGIARLSEQRSRPTIGDGVNIGAGVVILGAVHIGARSTIGANAVVVHDQPADALIVGAPARARPLQDRADTSDNAAETRNAAP